VSQVVEVSVEVSSGAARFRVAVRAESVRRTANIVAARYPDGNCRVKFPINSEDFFANGAAAGAGIVGLEKPDVIAA
jgi:hypothetical protein